MPAPQVLVVQLHSPSFTVTGVLLVGTRQVLAADWGNAVAVLRNVLVICAGVSVVLTPSISATVPETMGAEELVPRLALY